MPTDKINPNEDRTCDERGESITLGPAVWQRVFNSPLVQQTRALFEQIFKYPLGHADFEAGGITPGDWKRLGGQISVDFLPQHFCRVITKTAEGRRRCILEDKQGFGRVSTTGKLDIWTCHAGLTEILLPIMYRGKYCGCVTTTGTLLHGPNQAEWNQIAERVKDTGVDLEALKSAYFQITPISEELLKVMLTLMETLMAEIIKAVVETEEDKKRIAELETALYGKYKFEKMIGRSPAMQEIFKFLRRVIDTDSPILIEGETGTGKELLAQVIHYNSPREDKLFMPINCGGMTETLLESELFGHIKGSFTGAIRDKKGLFEVSDQGTVFLDEIAEMSPALQVKFLRVLQEGTFLPVGGTDPRKVDVRIISATNKNLKELVAKGDFREDLYYRLNVIKIALPPLRKRQEDIPLLVEHFIKTMESARKKNIVGVRNDALKYLLNYNWPGNIRELQNVLERAIALASTKYVTREDLPEEIIKRQEKMPYPMDIHHSFEEVKKEYFYRLLTETRGNVTQSAQRAQLDRSTFQRFLKKYHLKASDFKESNP